MESKEAEVPLADKTTIKYRGIKSFPFILGNETFEKLGTTAALVNMVVYLTSIFNLKSVTATLIINVFNDIINIAPLVGAFLSDTYFGCFASICSFLRTMAEAILYNVANEIIKILGSGALQQIGIWWGVNDELKKLENIVSTIQAVLLDAEHRQTQDLQIKDWLRKLQDVVRCR